MKRSLTILLVVVVLVMLSVSTGLAKSGPADISSALQAKVEKGDSKTINVLVSMSDYNYDPVIAEIEALGGSVYETFDYAKGFAATLPTSSVSAIAAFAGVESIALDAMRTLGTEVQPLVPHDLRSVQDLDEVKSEGKAYYLTEEFESLTFDPAALPDTFQGPTSMNATPVWNTGNMGQESLVAVIDTGVYPDHFMLSGSVVGGVDLSSDVGTAFEGFDRPENHWHGTHVSGIIAGHGAILVNPASLLAQSYEHNSGEPLPDAAPYGYPGLQIMFLTGIAPASQIYGIKVFDHTGGSTPTSTIIAGIEHAIMLHETGVYDVDAINMSLGGANLFDGRDLEDQVVDYATSVGITMVVAAGNEGPASQTVSAPGTANTSITTGAVVYPLNTRISWDMYFGFVGAGDLLYVDDDPQMMYFSSRGPTADNRMKPTASAVGVDVLSALTPVWGSIAFASGTSMATPGMAGVVALLNTQSELHSMGASPYDYKQAIMAGSNMLEGFDEFEQGAGFIDAAAAMYALMNDHRVGEAHPELRRGYSANTVMPGGERLAKVNGGRGQTFKLQDLAPGHVEHFYFDLHPNAEKITIEVTDVELGVDPIEFNAFEVHLASGITSSGAGYHFYSVNVWGDAYFEVAPLSSSVEGSVYGVNAADLPLMPGFVRLTIENDWTSFDSLSGTVNVKVFSGNQRGKADESYSGMLNTEEVYGFFPVGFGENGVALELSWKNDWSKYPTSDLDMYVVWIDTDGAEHWEFGGATLNAPEMLSIDSTDITAVYVLLYGYDTNGVDEPWTLEVNYK